MSKYKLYFLITVVFGVVIIVAGYITTVFVKQKLDTNLIDAYALQEQIIAQNVAKSLSGDIQATQNQLLVIGRNPTIRDGEADACNAEIKNELILTNSKLGNVGRVDREGMFRCSLNAALIGTPANKLGAYIDDIFNDPAHNPVMSRSIKVPGRTGYLVALHVPVTSPKGEFDGTLGGAIYLEDLEQKYLKDVVFANQGYVILFDDDNTIMYHVRPELIGTKATSTEIQNILKRALVDKSGTAQYTSSTQGLKVAGYQTLEVVPGRQWVVLVTIPVADVAHELEAVGVHKLLTSLWVFVALVVLGAGAGFLFFSQKLVFRPLKQIQEMKSDFVSLVSHQLKTPVAQIKGYVENMLEGLAGKTTEKQKEYLNDMLNVANKNSKLIDDLLNISRIERGMLKVEIEKLVIDDLLKDVLGPLHTVAGAKKVILTESLLNKPVSINGDPVKTREALRNIVDNAIKFTDAGKTVAVSAEEGEGGIIVKVADQGTGIDPDVQKELFEKNRVWSGKVKASGAGLGLFLSKQFIELTGGTIRFVTAPGKGTTFIITFPKA